MPFSTFFLFLLLLTPAHSLVPFAALTQSISSVFQIAKGAIFCRVLYHQLTVTLEIKRESMHQYFNGMDEIKQCINDIRSPSKKYNPFAKRTGWGSCVAGPLRAAGGVAFFTAEIPGFHLVQQAATMIGGGSQWEQLNHGSKQVTRFIKGVKWNKWPQLPNKVAWR